MKTLRLLRSLSWGFRVAFDANERRRSRHTQRARRTDAAPSPRAGEEVGRARPGSADDALFPENDPVATGFGARCYRPGATVVWELCRALLPPCIKGRATALYQPIGMGFVVGSFRPSSHGRVSGLVVSTPGKGFVGRCLFVRHDAEPVLHSDLGGVHVWRLPLVEAIRRAFNFCSSLPHPSPVPGSRPRARAP